MAKPTKIVVHFDDGTTTDIPAQGVGSIFMNEGKAKQCGHNPPYGPPPHAHAGGSTTGSGSEDADGGTGGTVSLMDTGDSCYIINGVIVCP
jgi:hypothetical protein